MRTGKLAIGMTAAAFAGFGIASLMRPEILEKVDVKATSSTGTAEIRAMYGGMEAGFGAFFAVALAKPEWRRPALAANRVRHRRTSRRTNCGAGDGPSQARHVRAGSGRNRGGGFGGDGAGSYG